MHHAICTVAAAAVRKEPSHRTEMVNQLLFGETMEVLEATEEWLKIKSLYDDYEGWITNHLVSGIDQSVATADINYVATGLVNQVTLPDQLINVPMGSALVGFNEETKWLWDEQHKYHGTYRNMQQPFDIDLLWPTMQVWINAPYLWGGKTFMGVDCSGFVQTIYKVLGVPLLRDAYQQAEQGTMVADVDKAHAGDVVFFQNEAGKITHVGIVLKNNKIIHASGTVRIDRFTREGIF